MSGWKKHLLPIDKCMESEYRAEIWKRKLGERETSCVHRSYPFHCRDDAEKWLRDNPVTIEDGWVYHGYVLEYRTTVHYDRRYVVKTGNWNNE